MATREQQQNFVSAWWGQAQGVGGAVGINAELVLATWSLDTGWGDAQGMMECHALLGIVCFTNQYPCTLGQRFLCFPSWADFISTFTQVMHEHQYDVVRAQGSLEGQVSALANQTGFAGGESTYEGKLLSVINTNRQFIGGAPVSVGGPPAQPSAGGGSSGLGVVILAGLFIWWLVR